MGATSQSFFASFCHFAQVSSWRLPITALRFSILSFRAELLEIFFSSMSVSAGMPSDVSPKARTEQGCMRQ